MAVCMYGVVRLVVVIGKGIAYEVCKSCLYVHMYESVVGYVCVVHVSQRLPA